MAWELWVPLVVVAVVLVTVVVVRFRRASRVFNRIIEQLDEDRAAEVGRHRSEGGRRTSSRGERGFAGVSSQGQHRSSGRRQDITRPTRASRHGERPRRLRSGS
jgi:hypothetical protein